MNCINCGKTASTEQMKKVPTLSFYICQACDLAGEQLEELLAQGIDLKYSDGSEETLKG